MLWGAVVNNSRSWARQVTTVMRLREGEDPAAMKRIQRRLVYHQIAFAQALRQHLRGLEPWDDLARLLDEAEVRDLQRVQNVPLALQQKIGFILAECKANGWIDMPQWKAMDDTLNDLTDAMGGAERLKYTPMPKQYDFYPQLFVHLYCILLPLALVTDMGWFTPLGSTAVGFMFLALDKIGRDLEEPFDNKVYDVPMTSLTTTIERNLRELLGESDLPAVEQPVDGVLW
jgi:putative membrane protein